MTEWVPVKLGDLIEIRHGFAFKGEYFCDNETHDILVTPGNFAIGGGFQLNKPKYYNGPVPDDYILRSGDVIVTMTDLSKQADTLGYSAFVPDGNYQFLHNQRIGKVELKSDRASLKYLAWLMRTAAYRHTIVGSATGSTVKHTSPTRIMDYRFNLPGIELQIAIADVLTALDDKIELNRRMNATLEAQARALFRDWFVDFGPTRAKQAGAPAYLAPHLWSLFPSTLDAEGKPEGWEYAPLKELLVLQRGFDLPKDTRTDGAFPVIAASGPSGTHHEMRVRGPGVCTGRSGVLGGVYYVAEDFWPLNTSLWIKEYPNSTPLHAFHILQEIDIGVFNAGSAVPTLNRNHIHELLQIKPPMAVVSAFDDLAGQLYKLREANLQESRTLAQTRDLLLPKLMSGDISVRALEAALG